MGAFGKVDGAVDGTIGRVNALKESLLSVAREAESLKIPGMGGFGSGSRGESEEHGGRGGLMRHLEQQGGGIGHFASSLIGGPAGAVIGGGMIAYEGFKQAFSVAESENNMRISSVSDDKIREADDAAGNYSRHGMSKLQALEAIRMGMVPLNRLGGSKDEGVDAAMGVLPQVAQFQQLASAMKGEEGGGEATKQLFELFKGDELRNKLSPADAQQFIKDYAQVYEGTSGKVDPKTFYQGLKYSKSAGAQFSDDFVKYYLPGIEMEEGGSTAGTMLMTSASAFLGQRFKKPALGERRQMGIYDENDKLQNQDQLIENPFKWMQETFMPALVKAGFDTKDKQVAEVEKLTSRNSAEAAVLLGINPGNVERTAQSIRQADTLNQASAAITGNDPMAAMRASEAGLANLATALGGPFIPQITGGLSNLANALNWTAGLTKTHIGPDGKPLTLDSAHDETGDWLRSFATPSSAADKEAMHGHQISGRDPRSPSSGLLAYSPSIAAPPSVTVQPALSVTTLPISITVDNGGMLGAVTKLVDARITAALSGLAGMFKSGAGNSSAGFDGRSAPSTPDGSVMHGGH
jgi:hypothetical protein